MTGSQSTSQPATSEADIKENGQQNKNKYVNTMATDLPDVKSERLAKLIGKKALTQCNLNGLAVSALLDTGAQVSIIDKEWKKSIFLT